MNPNLPTGETLSDGEPSHEAAESCEVPLALIGDAQPGSTITVKVVSRDENGMAVIAPADEPETESEGSDEMAAQFDQAPTTQTI